jgi:3-oxoacyl-[acyl-carrier protein] reductase
MDLNLTHKHAVVCGSTQGIGRAIAHELAALGAQVTLVARNDAALREVQAALPTPQGQQHGHLVADFVQPDQLAAVLQGFLATASPVHILINNTGGPPGGPAVDAQLAEFTQAFAQHLLCNQLLVQAFVPHMKQAGYGRIVNIISTSVKEPIQGLGVSNTIRGAVASWGKTLATELAPFGITVNNVLPGYTSTGRLTLLIGARAAKAGKATTEVEAAMLAEVPAGRFGTAGEIAAVAAFWCTPAAAYVNGTSLAVDGGRTRTH